jgi:hypothetical protein
VAKSVSPTMTEISHDEFWDNVGRLTPLLRLGDPDGPGAFINSEPWDLRRCAVTDRMDNTYRVSVVLKGADGEPQFFQHDEPLTLNEFKALCDRIMPGVGVCGMRWGANLCDGARTCWMRTANCAPTSSTRFVFLFALSNRRRGGEDG